MSNVAIVGGTGDLGMGLAVRLANKHHVVIGSRDAARAQEAAAKVAALCGAAVTGNTNDEAAEGCELAILAIPDLPSDEALLSLKPRLAGKLVISPIVAMAFRDGSFFPTLESGSAAEKVASALQTRVAGAFHTVPAARLLEVGGKLDYDVLVTADTGDVYAEAAALISSIEGLRPLYAGALRNSRMVEGITPTLLNIGKLNKIRSPSIKVV
jgi:8-hydroxy-5-deazaflavin:NADPH oxidoreductase